MPSLKSFLPKLAPVVGSTPDALYGRQRALVQLGILHGTEGRGPGSGVPLSAETLAPMIVAMLSADTLQETDDRVRAICEAAPNGRARCPWTGEKTFRAALGKVMSSDKMLESLASVAVYRNYRAQILYGRPTDSLGSIFDVRGATPPKTPAIAIVARIEAEKLREIVQAFRRNVR